MQPEDHLKGLEIELSYARKLKSKKLEELVQEQIAWVKAQSEDKAEEDAPEPEEEEVPTEDEPEAETEDEEVKPEPRKRTR